MTENKKIRALVLLSGGLDSMLAVKVLEQQGIEVTGLSFKSRFFDTERAKKAAENLGINLIEIDFSDEHLGMVKNPPHGYGKNMNPCIDCHGMMLAKAHKLLDEQGFDFLATGEVLGQRPMSQNKEALYTVAGLSGVAEKVVRPLSAKLLDETEVEKRGIVTRGRLLDISGRTRERQMELADKFGITDYPGPAGGCLLTDPEFSQRLIKLFGYWPDADGNDVEIQKNGRVFWLSLKDAGQDCKTAVIVSRDQVEGGKLAELARKGDIMVELKEEKGPLTIIRARKTQFQAPDDFLEVEIPKELKMSGLKMGEGKSREEILAIAGLLTGYYSPKARGKKHKLSFITK